MNAAQTDGECIRRFEVITGVEVVVHGDESRFRLARQIIEQRDAISARAVRLLESFMRDRGEFDLASIEVLPAKGTDGGDFSLRYTFVAERDLHEYGYTYFEVCFSCHEPPAVPFWPYKFTVGFH